MNMNVLGIIPARGGSKGIPKKNVVDLNGKPLIFYTIDAALTSKVIDKLIVSTDDENIAKIARKFGSDVVMRPAHLAGDKSPTISTINHVIEILSLNSYIPDIIILLQPTSPLRNYLDIKKSLDQFISNKCESLIAVNNVDHSPYWNFKIKNSRLIPIFDEKYLKYRRQDLPEAYIPNGSIFISKPKTIKDYNGFYTSNIFPYVMPPERSLDIDTKLELEFAKFLLNN